jgi:AAA domain
MSEGNSPPAASEAAAEQREKLYLIGCHLHRPGELAAVPDRADWLWHGYLARGQITLLTGQWKIGKTALLACLLARLGAGGQLAGREVRPGRTIVLTEEGAMLWHGRCRQFGIGDNVSFAFRPFVQRPVLRHWKLLADDLMDLHRHKPVDLVVFDPLATLWPCGDENNAGGVMEALEPVRNLAGAGMAVLLLHHPRKERLGAGRESRGSGALSAFVDVLIEMHWCGQPEEPDRRRRLLAWSRHDATPRQLLIELNAEGNDYIVGQDDSPGATLAAVVRQLLESTPNLSARDLLDRWPADSPRPLPTVLQRYLSRAVAENELICTGAGHRYEPYRYRVAAAEGDQAAEFALPKNAD